MMNFNGGGRGVLGGEQIDTEHKVPHTNLRARAEQKLMARKRSMRNRTKRYNCLLSPVNDKFDALDLNTFRPFKVVEDFWWKYRCEGAKFNLYDLILLAKSAARKSDFKREDLSRVLDDFSLFMIASYTIHYMDYDDSAVGKYVFFDDPNDIKQEIRFSFLKTLVGITEGGRRD